MYCMIDIETIGTMPEAVVISIGAVNYNKNGIANKKLWVLDMDVQREKGRLDDPETLQWWKEQSKEARKVFAITEGRVHPFDWVEEFHDFLAEGCELVGEKFEGFKDIKPVGNGANFDITIIEHLITQFAGKSFIPWKFWNVWCFRTFNHLTKCKDLHPRAGVHHDALDDAIYQAECMMKVWDKQKKKKGV